GLVTILVAFGVELARERQWRVVALLGQRARGRRRFCGLLVRRPRLRPLCDVELKPAIEVGELLAARPAHGRRGVVAERDACRKQRDADAFHCETLRWVVRTTVAEHRC